MTEAYLTKLVQKYYNKNYKAEKIRGEYGIGYYVTNAGIGTRYLSKTLKGAINNMEYILKLQEEKGKERTE